MTQLERLQASDAANTIKLDEAIALLQSQPNNDAALGAIADSLDAKTAKIQAVIDSNKA